MSQCRHKKILTQMPQVAIMLETTHGYSRELIRGILEYQNLHGPWGIYFEPGGSSDQKLPRKRDWRVDGILCWITNRQIEKEVLAAKVPTVLIDPWQEYLIPTHPFSRYSHVRGDSQEMGRMAAQFYLEKGLPYFGFVGHSQERIWCRERKSTFMKIIREAGFPCFTHPSSSSSSSRSGTEYSRLCHWLREVPKPIGIFAMTDVRGREVVNACLQLGIDIPREVFVLGVDNDILLCETSNPPMSSISVDFKRGGYLAAELLDRQMKNLTLAGIRLTYPCKEIVRRRSTDRATVSDPLVADAMEFIRINSSTPIDVSDVVRYLDVSRRTIENRFRKALNRTINEEILQVRMKKVQNLVSETDLPIKEIARSSGYDNESYMGKTFRKFFGMSPTEYRMRRKKDPAND